MKISASSDLKEPDDTAAPSHHGHFLEPNQFDENDGDDEDDFSDFADFDHSSKDAFKEHEVVLKQHEVVLKHLKLGIDEVVYTERRGHQSMIKDEDFVKVALGKMNPQIAFMRGAMKIKGSMSAAQKFTPDIFPKPSKL